MTALPGTAPSSTPGPLDGIVVADFARVLAGPYCTMLLADLGATVIKVESPDGDDTRGWMPPVYKDQASYYQAVNRNKHSIALDLKDEDDRETARRIATRADVFVHNFKPGSIERLGFGFLALGMGGETVEAGRPEPLIAAEPFGRLAQGIGRQPHIDRAAVFLADDQPGLAQHVEHVHPQAGSPGSPDSPR